MKKFIISDIVIPVREAYGCDIESIVMKKCAGMLHTKDFVLCNFDRRSIDARHKNQIRYVVSAVFEAEDDLVIKNNLTEFVPYEYGKLKTGSEKIKRPVITGSGPCGLYCAYLLSLYGFDPIIIERGKPVEEREKDTQRFFDTGELDPDSNIQFGEGGAGTFSDGKLMTRIHDPRCGFVLSTMKEMGADDSVLYEAKPHVGTDVIRKIMVNMREKIKSNGGTFMYGSKLTDIFFTDSAQGKKVTAIEINGNNVIDTDILVLAIGHSARDTYKMLFDRGVEMEQKAFSVGFRIEHLQEDINECRYGKEAKYLDENADYQLYETIEDRSVYTFCMCPGGYVINASSESGCLTTNGMSLKARDGCNANSAWVISVDPKDFPASDPLAGIEFQRSFERSAYRLGGGHYVAPVQSIEGFINGEAKKCNSVTPTIRPGFSYCDLNSIYSRDINSKFVASINSFENKIKCFRKGVLTGCETRTSAPLKITRDEAFMAKGMTGLYPCGEGAGKAGGIVSSAVDGIKAAEIIIGKFHI
ncbi:MAG: hypothetical protein WCY62_03475 [Clostridia bacterium]